MITWPRIPGGYAIFCDDIRDESSGKTSYIGTYSGEMTVYSVGTPKIRQLCVAFFLRLDSKNLPGEITIQLIRRATSDESIFETSIDLGSLPSLPEPSGMDDVDTINFLAVNFRANIHDLVIPGPCKLSARVIIHDDEFRVGSLSVKLATPEIPSETDPA